MPELTVDMHGTIFSVALRLDDLKKVSVIISSNKKRGTIEKTVTGRNAEYSAVIAKLKKFFATGGKW